MIRALALAALLCAAPVLAQVSNPPFDVTAAQKAQQALDTAAAIAAAMPQPADTMPPPEQVAPVAGTSMRYRRADDVQPRITRATSCVLTAGGVCTVTYPALINGDPNVLAFAINNGAQPITCGPSAAATATTASIRCYITQNTVLTLALVTTGLSLIPATAAPTGTVVQITLLPKT